MLMSAISSGHDPNVPRLLDDLIKQNSEKLESLTDVIGEAGKEQERANKIMIKLTWGIFILTVIIVIDVILRLLTHI